MVQLSHPCMIIDKKSLVYIISFNTASYKVQENENCRGNMDRALKCLLMINPDLTSNIYAETFKALRNSTVHFFFRNCRVFIDEFESFPSGNLNHRVKAKREPSDLRKSRVAFSSIQFSHSVVSDYL